MTCAPGPLQVLVDADDDATLTRALLTTHDLERGYVVVHPTPGYRSTMVLAADVLVALGHSPVLQPYEQRETVRGPAAAWAHAQQVTHLVVLRAHLLTLAAWQMMTDLARTAGAGLVMVCHTYLVQLHPSITAFLTYTPHQVVTKVTAVLPDAGPARVLEQDHPGTVRAAERADRRTAFADRVQARARGERLTRAWLDEQALLSEQALRTEPPPAPGSSMDWLLRFDWPVWLDYDGLRAFLAALVLHSPDQQTTAAALDGAACGFAHHGLRLSVPDLVHRAGPGMTTRPVTAQIVDRIRSRVSSPRHAAALVVILITEVWPALLPTITIDGLAHDAATVTLPANTPERLLRRHLDPATARSLDPAYRTRPVTFGVPAPARPLLQAARCLALLHGAGCADPLLTDRLRPCQDPVDGRVLTMLATVCDIQLPHLQPMGTTWMDAVRCAWSTEHYSDARRVPPTTTSSVRPPADQASG
ncbi:MAG: hypothetical protein QG597_1187 [Actinomycetota bacterium]|nr:hypothetical protein [Actinomycetota bacterium]